MNLFHIRLLIGKYFFYLSAGSNSKRQRHWTSIGNCFPDFTRHVSPFKMKFSRPRLALPEGRFNSLVTDPFHEKLCSVGDLNFNQNLMNSGSKRIGRKVKGCHQHQLVTKVCCIEINMEHNLWPWLNKEKVLFRNTSFPVEKRPKYIFEWGIWSKPVYLHSFCSLSSWRLFWLNLFIRSSVMMKWSSRIYW